MGNLFLSTEELAKYVFKKRRLEVFNSVYNKLFEDVVLSIKEQAHDLVISEIKNHSLEFVSEEEESDFIIKLQQLMHEELSKGLSQDL